MKHIKKFESITDNIIRKGNYIIYTLDFKKFGEFVIKANKPYKVLDIGSYNDAFGNKTRIISCKIKCENDRIEYIRLDDIHLHKISKKDAQLYFDTIKYNL